MMERLGMLNMPAGRPVLSIQEEVLEELQKAHVIINIALNAMPDDVQAAFCKAVMSAGVDGEGITRAQERGEVIARLAGHEVRRRAPLPAAAFAAIDGELAVIRAKRKLYIRKAQRRAKQLGKRDLHADRLLDWATYRMQQLRSARASFARLLIAARQVNAALQQGDHVPAAVKWDLQEALNGASAVELATSERPQ